MLCSVVIPTCHRNDFLAKCLDRLALGKQEGAQLLEAGSQRSEDELRLPDAAIPLYEVIVTDDGSTTTARELIERSYPWSHWVAGPRKGPAANRNNGAKNAHGDWLVFVDDDCVPDAVLIHAYEEAVRRQPEFAVFEGRTFVDRPRRTLAESSPINESGGYLWACNFAIQKKLFATLGGFDERFPYATMEDVDFRLRLKQAGKSFAFVPTASVCHPWRPDNIKTELAKYEESLAIYLRLHPEQRPDFGKRAQLMIGLRGLLKDTILGLWRYRGAGLTNALRRNLFFLGAAIRKFPKPACNNSERVNP